MGRHYDEEDNQGGIVYVLTNPEMPGLVKIGKTSRKEVQQRLVELYSTGVPVPFECEYAARVSDEGVVEKAFHTAFEPYRINPNREFFRIDPEQAIALLELLAVEDVTPGVQEEADDVESDTVARATIAKRSRRPNLNFEEMDVPTGSKLKFINSDETVEVVDSRRVKFKEETYYLTAITKILLGDDNNSSMSRTTSYWTYDGQSLSGIYEDTYGPRGSVSAGLAHANLPTHRMV